MTPLAHHRVAPGVSRFRLSAREFEFFPSELSPFGVRFVFGLEQNEEGSTRYVLRHRDVSPPDDSRRSQWTELSAQHERTLEENWPSYRRYAELAIAGRLPDAGDHRAERLDRLSLREMDMQRVRLADLPDAYLRSLEQDVAGRRASGDTVERIAADLGIGKATLYRRLNEARRRRLPS